MTKPDNALHLCLQNENTDYLMESSKVGKVKLSPRASTVAPNITYQHIHKCVVFIQKCSSETFVCAFTYAFNMICCKSVIHCVLLTYSEMICSLCLSQIYRGFPFTVSTDLAFTGV